MASRIDAMILDLDGVITHTAKLHAIAWKQLFDFYNENLRVRGHPGYAEFIIDPDYHLYVDGKPRQDGVRDFLKSRGITLPLGEHEDPPDRETLHGLANLKNTFFTRALKEQGPEIFPDAVEAIQQWREQGLKIAVASSSKNCKEILQLAKLEHLFDARIDGTHLQLWNMPGKPAPDMFLAATRELGIEPARAAVLEDALSGVQAAVAGQFGLVVGVARFGLSKEPLRRAGADIVITRLTEISFVNAPGLMIRLSEEKLSKIRK